MRPISPGLAFPSESRGVIRWIGFLFLGLVLVQHRARPGEYVDVVYRSATACQLTLSRQHGKAYQDIHMLHQQRVRIIQLIERNVDLKILLR